MPTTVTLTPDTLPDVNATKHDDGDYEVEITGITGLEDRTLDDLVSSEKLYYEQRGILEINPPKVRHADKTALDLLMLEAVEKAMPDGLLDNDTETVGALDKELLLCGQLVRVVRLALNTLEVPDA